MMLEVFRESISGLMNGIAEKAVILGINANIVTILGLITSTIAFYVLYMKNSILGGLLILVAGFFDILDGAVARKMNKAGIVGSFLDSVVDRVEDGLILFGMGIYSGDLLMGALAIHASMLVSYIRAKAESLGIKGTQYSLIGRAERIILAALFCLAGYVEAGLVIIAILSYLTAAERASIFFKNSAKAKEEKNE